MPGPGSYDPRFNINKEGKYILSTYKNSAVRKFGSGASNEPSSSNGFYSTQISGGHYRHSSTGDRLYGSANAMRHQTPGPGSYRIISEFGKYDLSATGALTETQATTPVKRAFSAMGFRDKRK